MNNATAIIQQAEADGLRLLLTEHGTVKLIGNKPAVERWAVPIRENKSEIIEALRNDDRDHAALARLVTRVCRAYKCTPEEVDEAINAALRDFEAAQETYASMARNLGITVKE